MSALCPPDRRRKAGGHQHHRSDLLRGRLASQVLKDQQVYSHWRYASQADRFPSSIHGHLRVSRNLTLCDAGLYSANWKPAGQVDRALSAEFGVYCGKSLT